MDFKFSQQIEEILVQKPTEYDITMEPILKDINTDENILSNAYQHVSINQQLTDYKEFKTNTTMITSSEFLDTPSDSGIQLLDSESSELMIESITSQNGFDFDEKSNMNNDQNTISCGINKQIPDLLILTNNTAVESAVITKSDLENSNIIEATTIPVDAKDMNQSNIARGDDVMTTSNCSTFDTAEIVYRRKTKKQSPSTKAPKKRVSFHEDILKNTRTDNIHIEHGFITYKNGRKNVTAGRYSWCENDPQQLHQPATVNNERRIVYRNACSDVLDYGNADIYDIDSNVIKNDNSGIFEYHNEGSVDNKKRPHFYKCSCNSSDSSLDSDNSSDNNKNNRNQYAQSKSNSCDCIGLNNTNNNFIGDTCYFSDPNIDSVKSVWSKEKKPKSSCLKKSSKKFIPEYDLTASSIKKFNVHDMNNLLDNSKMIFGSLKNIFSIPLPERGVPEGSEDVQSVYECIPEYNVSEQLHQKQPSAKVRTFLSKSLDGNKNDPNKNGQKKFVHNVDEQLRRNNQEDLYALTRQNSNENNENDLTDNNEPITPDCTEISGLITEGECHYRNKYIVNCESTVFEHTGVSYCYENVPISECGTPVAEPSSKNFIELKKPFKETFANIFKTLKETTSGTVTSPGSETNITKFFEKISSDSFDNKKPPQIPRFDSEGKLMETVRPNPKGKSNSSTSSDKQSVCSDSATDNLSSDLSWNKNTRMIGASPTKIFKNIEMQHGRHLSSPLRQQRNLEKINHRSTRMSPDIFNLYNGRDSKASTLLSEEFDDILTITTTTTEDKNDSDIVILDYPENLTPEKANYCGPNINSNFLKPPKTSLINRFLKNVTQKKIIETSIKKNPFFANKLKKEKLLSGGLYVKGGKVTKPELVDDLNAEIANEIEASTTSSPKRDYLVDNEIITEDISRFELGIGEISIDIFNGNCLHILSNSSEVLMKVFKLYTGYSEKGYMTPVLVFLTDKAIYVTDLVRNKLCNKFILKYSELDVILMGPYGNTVLLSNSSRDMQQVLLAGGPYPADGLVANLELCARKSGAILPAVGQLTLQHLAPLRAFVQEHSTVSKSETWEYYAVVNIPAATLNSEQEPLGPNIKGFLMHRRINESESSSSKGWHAGYFLLKAGVLYMFNDSTQKLPTWAVALAECQGARRSVNTGRPHCFEILLKRETLQLAAPDEYVASEWLQALVQSASGLFELQEKHKTLGCTLIMTQYHLITLREDFTAPLKCLKKKSENLANSNESNEQCISKDCHIEPSSLESDNTQTSSVMSTPTKNANRSHSSINSTPTKTLRSTTNNINTISTNSTPINLVNTSITESISSKKNNESEGKISGSMTSFYGNNSGIEVLTCATIKEMTGIRIPSDNEIWWCVLEFSCQEVRETSDDLVIFFSSSSEMQRFLRMLEQLWQSENNDLFPITILDEDDIISDQCTKIYMDIDRSWEPMLSAALGYPL